MALEDESRQRVLTAESLAQLEIAKSVLPIIFIQETIDPGVIDKGWLFLMSLIEARLGRKRIDYILSEYLRERKTSTQRPTVQQPTFDTTLAYVRLLRRIAEKRKEI